MNHLNQKITKTKWMVVCLSFACILQMASCDKEEPLKSGYFALIDDTKGTYATELLVTPNGGVKTLTLISNREWEIIYDKAPWIDISPTSGHGVATVSVTVTPNESLKEDSIYISVINNTLLVVDELKVKRQNYLATYKGSASVTSPIESICTTCTPEDADITGIAASSVLSSASGKIILNFSTTFKLSTSFTMNLTFEGNMQTVMENGETKFIYHGDGTFDLTPLGEIINDPSVTGVKDIIIDTELKGGLLSFQAVIDPGPNGSVKPDVSTVIMFEGNR